MLDRLLQQLSPSQQKAVLHKEGPLLVIAGPGSGKTRVITCRIAALIDSGVTPRNICAITFTNKAAEQMRLRASAIGASAGAHISTFHSLCVRILRKYAQEADIKPNFSIYNESDQARCMRQAVKDCGLDTTNFSPARMLDAVSALKNRLIDVDSFREQADDFFSKTLSNIYSRYQNLLIERNGLDFDDLLARTAFLLEACEDVRNELSERFKFLLIDEYQDTNHAQYRIAKALVCIHNNICVTGDPDQSIYAWRGADIKNMLNFEQDWPDATIIKLEENFRSTPNILMPADKLIAFNRKRKLKTLIPTRNTGPDVEINIFEDENHEAQAIAEKIEHLAEKGTRLNDIAVFYRVNAASRSLEEAFIENKIPYQVVRGIEFYNRKEIRDLLAYLKVLVNPADAVALARIINTPARGIGKTTIEKVLAYAQTHNTTFFDALKKAQLIDSLKQAQKAKVAAFVNMIEKFTTDSQNKPVAALARQVFTKSDLKKHLKELGERGQDAIENVNELINGINNYDRQTGNPSLIDYLQQISLFSDADSYDDQIDRVALMTLHAAKGLEFENVFIIGLEDGLLPHQRSTADDDQLEEERRLFFVGMTRAKTNLNISYARYRTLRGQLLRTIPSQFLFELGLDFQQKDDQAQYGDDDCQFSPYDMDQTCLEFTTGRLIRHKSFGLGRVKDFIDMGENSVIVVQFNSGKTKSLMVKYANLEVVDDF